MMQNGHFYFMPPADDGYKKSKRGRILVGEQSIRLCTLNKKRRKGKSVVVGYRKEDIWQQKWYGDITTTETC